jgi:hypothetical protein
MPERSLAVLTRKTPQGIIASVIVAAPCSAKAILVSSSLIFKKNRRFWRLEVFTGAANSMSADRERDF